MYQRSIGSSKDLAQRGCGGTVASKLTPTAHTANSALASPSAGDTSHSLAVERLAHGPHQQYVHASH